MIARRLILMLVSLYSAACCGAAILTPPDIPEQPLIRNIYAWGDRIAVITEWIPGQKRLTNVLHIVDRASSRIVSFRELSCDAYHDIAHSVQLGRLLVCGIGTSARIYGQTGQVWSPLSEPVQGTDFRLAVDGDRMALVSEDTIYVLSGSSKKETISIPIGNGAPRSAPTALLLDGDSLLVAYNHGEFGGALHRYDLKRPGSTPAKIVDDNVSVMARSRSGVIWAAAGLAHMIDVHGAIYEVGPDRVRLVAAISGFQGRRIGEKITRRAGVQFPGLTTVAGLALGKEDRPILLLPPYGVFELIGEKFVSLYKGPLTFSYSMPSHSASSWPVGLAIGEAGDIFVASRTLGVLLLRKNNDRYDDIEQLIFEDPVHTAPPNPTR